MVAGDFNFSAQPTSRLTVVNHTSVNNLRINGPSSYTDIVNGSNSGQTIYFRYMGRLVRTIEGFSLPAFADSSDSATYENTNHLNSGTVGVRLRPVKNLTA